MWDNARVLNIIAAALCAVSALLVSGAAVVALVRSPAFPLRSITVVGDLEHVRRTQIAAALQGRVHGTFFTVRLDELRDRFQSIPWVRRVEVRRRWPDRIEVRIEEHRALARWARPEDGQLVNTYGEPFSATSEGDLAAFSGPPGSEREVARRYDEFRQALQPLGLVPVQLTLTERLAWQLRLDNGMVLQLGRDAPRDPVSERLARFIEAYPVALARLQQAGARGAMRFDLRYPNGFALRVPATDDSGSRHTRPRA